MLTEMQFKWQFQIMTEQTVFKRTKVDERIFVTHVQRALAIGKLNCLLQRQQEMPKAGFTGAVRSEDNSQGCEADRSSIAPRLEVLDLYFCQHISPSIWINM